MLRLRLFLALSLLPSFAACLAADDAFVDSERQAITGGSPEAGYPSVFALAYNGQGGCTGTCITPTVGLTAAHCVEGEQASVLTALFGASEEQPQQIIQVTEVLVEPSFAADIRGADIALLRFAEQCPATTPYNPIPLESHVGEPVVMVGFGVTVESANDAGIKRSGVATLFSVAPAEVSGMNPGELATSNDPDGTCNGDSGGPTFMQLNGVEYVVGVTSRGSTGANGVDEPCGQGRSIATRPDSHAAFIDAFIGGEVTPPGGGGDDTPPGDGTGDDMGNGEGTGNGDSGNDSQGMLSSGCQSAGSGASSLAAALLLALAFLLRKTRARD